MIMMTDTSSSSSASSMNGANSLVPPKKRPHQPSPPPEIFGRHAGELGSFSALIEQSSHLLNVNSSVNYNGLSCSQASSTSIGGDSNPSPCKKVKETQVQSPVQKTPAQGIQIHPVSCWGAQRRQTAERGHSEADETDSDNESSASLVSSESSESEFAKDWPLPTSLDISPSEVVEVQSHQEESELWSSMFRGQDVQDRYYNMWTSDSADYKNFKDVKFEIGPDKNVQFGHELILSLFCEDADFRRKLHLSAREGRAIQCTELDPQSVNTVLMYIYKRTVEFTDVIQTHGVLQVANKFGIPDLKDKCMEFISSGIRCGNVLQMFCLALEHGEHNLKCIAVSFISRNMKEVLSSDEFLQLSEEYLSRFLANDDWCVEDEMDIFDAVIRWAKSHTEQLNPGPSQGTELNGSAFRKVIGKAFYQIRFVSLSMEKFSKAESVYPGLFTQEELLKFYRYLSTRAGETLPVGFNHLPRKEQKPQIKVKQENNVVKKENYQTSSCSENETANVQDEVKVIIENHAVNEDPNANNTTPGDSAGKSTNSLGVDEESRESPPPKKRKKKKNTTTTSCLSNGTSSLTDCHLPLATAITRTAGEEKCFHTVVNALSRREDTQNIENFDEEAVWTVPPKMRVHLPNLKKFKLNLIARNNFNWGALVKNYIKNKNLNDILFFDLNPRSGEETQPGTGKDVRNIMDELFSYKINVTINLEYTDTHNQSFRTLLLKINHQEGCLHMNLIKDAQAVIDAAKKFPLKVLTVNECQLSSVDEVNQTFLEVLIMRKVKGLKIHPPKFFETCTNLRSVSWNYFGSLEEFSLTESLLNKNKHMEKLAIHKGKLSLAEIACESGSGSLLQELYFDCCEWNPDCISNLPKMFPFVRRVQIYGNNCDAFLLESILRMESIEWIFMWELKYNYRTERSKKGNKKYHRVLVEESMKVQNFLISVFKNNENFVKQKNGITFILEKTKVLELPGSSSSAVKTPSNPFDASRWNGIKLGTTKYDTVSQWDYKNFLYGNVFSSYDEYCFLDSTETDSKRKKPKLNNSNDTVVSSSHSTAVNEPV